MDNIISNKKKISANKHNIPFQNKIIINASNIHTGGGKVLVNDLLIHLGKNFKNEVILFIDNRWDVNSKYENTKIIKISKYQRLIVWFFIFKLINRNDLILNYTNIPSFFKFKCNTFLIQSNRFVIEKNSITKKFNYKTRIRLFYEQFKFNLFHKNYDKIIVQSMSMKNILVNKGIDSNKILILTCLNYHDLLNTKSQLPEKNDETIFLYVASNDLHKNHSNLLKAWVHLSLENCFPKLILTIDRQNNLYNEIIRLKKQYKLNLEIKSNLNRKELFQLYKKVNLLIYPSTFESYAMPLAEAKSIGLPVICSELDFARDIIDPIETFNPYSSISIKRAVNRYLKRPNEKSKIITPNEFMNIITNDL